MLINIYFFTVFFVFLVEGKLELEINKKNDDMIYPVSSDIEEKIGNRFSLVCELVTTTNETSFDDQLSWKKDDENLKNIESFNEAVRNSEVKEINKSERKFDPLQAEDQGKYICISRKFNLHKAVKILVRDEIKRRYKKPMYETSYCNEHMFQCVSTGVCIIQHYVCDGVADCKDGSDESVATCTKNPCKDKIPCDDGRCIPMMWCCDRHHDPNCNVTVRPKCCHGLPDSYEEMELGFPNVPQTQHTARYLFILVCVVSILFSIILLLLIISKVLIFAKKSAIQQQRHSLCENIALRNQTNINVIPCDIYAYRNSRTPRNNIVRNIIIDTSDVNDPLLFNPARFNVINASSAYDQPPSYIDVIRSNSLLAEPPPPYKSQERINTTNNESRNEN
ncbi:low-density lipoprotein receptor class A domain-containing protein 3-like [Sitophilus oryzae]|uniref:Low-density lipoprotein receptor class A domain-containing protein 3-like n=1 Tax=Sitophilus oryzae TaxID=7048 RepID=A0A6J2YKN2_SITOR|nr:low-density lipoprotein receptor class A domain-containing protein 3-like [Sitophilus oryzae]